MTDQNVKRNPIEDDLFSYKSWDGDYDYTSFSDVILKRQIGDYATGDKFATVILNYGESSIDFYESELTETPVRYEMNLKFGNKIE